MPHKRISRALIPALIVGSASMMDTSIFAANITWSSGAVTGEEVVSNSGTLVEACNFGNSGVTAPTVNGVPFVAVDFTSGGSPVSLIGLTYNTGEDGKLPGPGVNELSDTIAYQSGVDPQTATLTGLSIGTDYEVQFFYYHNSVNRSVAIRDGNGNDITLIETGEPVYATGTFSADATTQALTFDANTGSQFFNAYQLRESTPVPPLVLGEVIINEFSASNNSGRADGDGNYPDWIEIWNSTTASVNLDGWFLTDDATIPNRWPFPAVTLEADAFLLVFASGQAVDDYVDAGGVLHTNFTLGKSDGYLGLMRPDGAGGIGVASEFDLYPAQETDVSYGFYGTEIPLSTGYLDGLTPGSPNTGQGHLGFVADTKFEPNRGFYSAPINVLITTATPGATIRYTTDGSEPSTSNGADYPGPPGIPVSGTTIIRAAAFLDGFEPTDIDTNTYLFAEDIVNQPANPPGFSTAWTGSDYAMEENAAHLALIAGDAGLSAAAAKAVIADALLELPAMSLSMNVEDWFSPSVGIYHNSTAGGAAWERACSAELIHPPGVIGEGGFQIDCGVRVQGFTSRNPSNNPKHSLRLAFRGQYGSPKLRYPFFGDDGPSEFDTIILRSNSQDAWVYSSSGNRVGQFIRDEWARKTHRAMGHASPTSNWVHLFVNGLYWGVYNPTERPDSAHSAAYFGGDKETYDTLKNHEEVLDGTNVAYKDLLALIQNNPNNFGAGYRDLSDPADYTAVTPFLDLEMMIDYMIHNIYAAATDWPGNNYVGYDRTGAHGGWKFYDWDNEHGMKNSVGTNRTAPHSRDNDSPTKFHHALRSNAEYRVLFGDRLHKAMFNGGVLYVDSADPAWDPAHPERNVPASRWMELTGNIETALIAESARWGDYRKSTPYTVFNEFQSVRNDLLQNWFPTRSSIVLSQFRAQGLYPNTEAPEFSQFGGTVPSGFQLTITAPGGGPIFYTLDGSDPRIPATTGPSTVLLDAGASATAIVPTASNPTTDWKDIGFDDATWQSGTTGVGYERTPSVYDPLIGLPIAGMVGNNETAYILVPFQIADAAALAEIGSLVLNMRYDDGFIAYLNGVQVAAANEPVAPPTWESGASGRHNDSLAVNYVPFDVTAFIGELVVGENILAIHGLNNGETSSDFLISPQLVAAGSSAVGISPTAVIYTGPVTLDTTCTVKARALDGGEWSALTEASFIVGTLATADNLVVSEIMYHPVGGTSHEYIEVMNVSTTNTIELTGVNFTTGITFEFPVGTTLASGGRLLVVDDFPAFETEHGAGHPVAGQYTGQLDNGGEQLVLTDQGGTVIKEFSYGDDSPWPEDADGAGYSLVLVAPGENPDHGDPFNWRASVATGGTPGTADDTQFIGVPDDDLDADGLVALIEYALGSSDTSWAPSVYPIFGVGLFPDGAGSEEFLTFTYRSNLAADDLLREVEISSDAQNWSSSNKDIIFVSSTHAGDGVALVTCRSATPMNSTPRQFMRLRVSTR